MKLSNIDKLNKDNKFYIQDIVKYGGECKSFAKKLESYSTFRKMDYVKKICLTFKPEDVNNVNLKKIVKELANSVLKKGIDSSEIIVSIDCQNKTYNFTDKEWENIEKIEYMLRPKGIRFGIEDERATWPVSVAKDTDKRLKQLAGSIAEKNMSPLEILLAVWSEVTLFEYKMEGDHHESVSRSTIGLLNSKYIVCVGYANYFRTLCEYINNSNIAVFKNNVQVVDDENDIYGGHQNLVVHIKDDKYKIKGFYYLDPTFDSSSCGADGTISYFMLPLKDIKNLQCKVYNIYTEIPVSEECQEEYDETKYSPLCHMNENEDGNDMSINAEDCLLDTRIQRFILKDKKFYELICKRIDKVRASGKKFPKYSSKIQECCRYLDLHPKIAELYLKQSSEPIDISTLTTAYNSALKAKYPQLDKDTISLHVYTEINEAIESAKYNYKKEAINCFSECGNFEENNEIIKM